MTRLLTGLAVLAALGCGQAAEISDCVTTCGLAVYGTTDCVAADQAEARVITAFHHDVDGWDIGQVCSALNGAHLYNLGTADGTWVDGWGRHVAGLTYCETKTMQVGTDNWAASAMAHEIAHLLECYVDRKAPTNHGDWEARNIHWAIAHASNPPKEWQP